MRPSRIAVGRASGPSGRDINPSQESVRIQQVGEYRAGNSGVVERRETLPSPTALGEPERGFPEGRRIISARPAIFFKILVDRSEGARLYSDHSLRRDCRGRPVLSIRLAFQAGVCRRVDASAGTWLKRFFDKWELKEKRGRRGSAVALSDHEIPAASRLRAHMDSESCSDVRSVNA